MAVEGGHQDSIGAGQIGLEAGAGLPGQGARGRIELDQAFQAAGQVQLPLQVPGPRRNTPKVLVQEEAGEVRQHPLGLAANVHVHEAGGGAPLELGGLVLDRDPGQLGLAGSAWNRSIATPAHGDLQAQVYRQGDHSSLPGPCARPRLQEAGVWGELERDFTQPRQVVVARVCAVDLKPPALNPDLATIGQLQAGGA